MTPQLWFILPSTCAGFFIRPVHYVKWFLSLFGDGIAITFDIAAVKLFFFLFFSHNFYAVCNVMVRFEDGSCVFSQANNMKYITVLNILVVAYPFEGTDKTLTVLSLNPTSEHSSRRFPCGFRILCTVSLFCRCSCICVIIGINMPIELK